MPADQDPGGYGPGQGPVYDPRYPTQPLYPSPGADQPTQQWPAGTAQPGWGQPQYEQGGPGGWGPGGPGGPEGPGGADRRLLIVIGVLAVAVIGVLAFVLGTSLGKKGDTAASTQPSVQPSSATTPPVTAPPSASAAASASPSASVTPTPNSAAYLPIPQGGSPDLDFGFLTKVTQHGDIVTVTFDRAVFYTGDAATQHNGGTPPDPGYLIQNENKKVRTFLLDPKASIQASVLLNGGNTDPVPMGRDDFVAAAARAIGQTDGGVPVWMRHTDGKNQTGPVTALAEQYLP